MKHKTRTDENKRGKKLTMVHKVCGGTSISVKGGKGARRKRGDWMGVQVF